MSVGMPTNVELLARKIEQDIRRRALRPGDKYLTADEAGKKLDVSSVTAHRAMKLLADRDILIRQRRAGTFIGNAVVPPVDSVRPKLHFIVGSLSGRDYGGASDHLANELLSGVTEKLPGVSVQVDLIGPSEGEAFVKTTVEAGLAASDFKGAILCRSTLETQRMFSESGLPAAVFGSLYPGIRNLTSLEFDQERIGELTAEYLLKQGHQRVALLMHTYWSPGENNFMAGFTKAISSSEKSIHFDVISLPSDDQVIEDSVTRVLNQSGRPTALVVRALVLAKRIPDVIRSMNLRVPKDIEIIRGNHHEYDLDGRPLPGAQRSVSWRECGEMLAEMIEAIQEQGISEPVQKLMPVGYWNAKE